MRINSLALALSLLFGTSAVADFSDGLEAFDGGDYQTAIEEWRPLAVAGDPKAQVALAGLLMQGLGTPRNSRLALLWYQRAARQGSVIAQVNLGDIYARGLGTKTDFVRAFAWLSVAARTGHLWALHRRDEIGQRLTEQQRIYARGLGERLTRPR